MIKKKTKNKAIGYFFLTSVVFHVVLLAYLGRSILERRYERRIEVDLKSLASTKQFRSIPQALNLALRQIIKYGVREITRNFGK